MKRFQNILCLVDALAPDQAALHRASELAVRNGANLKVVDVIDDGPTWLGMVMKSHAGTLEEDRRAQLQSLVESLPSDVGTVTTELLHGRPALAVVREVVRLGFDLVMKDARGATKQQTLFFDSIDMRLLRNCPCPVWLNSKDHGQGHDVILAAVDPLAEDAEGTSMNNTILELASSLAATENADLYVVSAWQARGESLLAGRVSHERFVEYVSEHHQAAEHTLAQALGRVEPRIERRRIHLRKGDPADVILSCANEIKCDLLVMGSVARALPDLLMGNTADTVLRQIECSVMTVKPDGFVSPVKLN